MEQFVSPQRFYIVLTEPGYVAPVVIQLSVGKLLHISQLTPYSRPGVACCSPMTVETLVKSLFIIRLSVVPYAEPVSLFSLFAPR